MATHQELACTNKRRVSFNKPPQKDIYDESTLHLMKSIRHLAEASMICVIIFLVAKQQYGRKTDWAVVDALCDAGLAAGTLIMLAFTVYLRTVENTYRKNQGQHPVMTLTHSYSCNPSQSSLRCGPGEKKNGLNKDVKNNSTF